MPKKFTDEEKARGVRMVTDRRAEHETWEATYEAVGRVLGIGAETLWRWTKQARVDAGSRTG
ncbi:hypothetical protein [Luteococcus sanguinis]|uniref:Transposase n=1 Tax=Luteococcus sanguinis TaxID=174038 RepID=A0ABW1WY06_9ACTN